MGGEVQRISIFLSVINVHVQNAPVSGKITRVKYTEGEFLNAMKADCAPTTRMFIWVLKRWSLPAKNWGCG